MSPCLRLRLLALALVASLVGSGATTQAAALGHPSPGHRPHGRPLPPLGEQAARRALGEVGVSYRFGGESPSGFDCSGLVRWSYLQVGIDLPHSSYALYGRGLRVSRSHLRPGDVLFFDGLGHVGLYVGHGRMVHAPYTGTHVQVVSLGSWRGEFDGARRIVAS